MPEINFATNPYGRIEQIVHYLEANEKEIKAESSAVDLANLITANKELLEYDLSLIAKELELETAKKKPADAARDAEIKKLSDEIAELKTKLDPREEELKKVKVSIEALRANADISLFVDSEAPAKKTQLAIKKLELAYTEAQLVAKKITREEMQKDTLNTDEIDAEINELTQSLAKVVVDFNKLNDENLQLREKIVSSLPKNASEINQWLLDAAANPKLIEDAQKSINTIKAENRSLLFRSFCISVFVLPIFHALAAIGNAICTAKILVAPIVSGINYFVKDGHAWKETLNNFGMNAVAQHAYNTLAYVLSAPISFIAGFVSAGCHAMKFATLIKLHKSLAEATTEQDLKAIEEEVALQRIESQKIFNGLKVNLNTISNESDEKLKQAATARAHQDATKLIEIKNEFLKKFEEAKAAAKAAPKGSAAEQKAQWTAAQYLAAANEHAFAFVEERKENMIKTIIAFKKAQVAYENAKKALAEELKDFNVAQDEAKKALGNVRFAKHNLTVPAYEKLVAAKALLEKNLEEARIRYRNIEDKESQAAKLEAWIINSYLKELNEFNKAFKIDEVKAAINARAEALTAEKKSYRPAGWTALRAPAPAVIKA